MKNWSFPPFLRPAFSSPSFLCSSLIHTAHRIAALPQLPYRTIARTPEPAKRRPTYGTQIPSRASNRIRPSLHIVHHRGRRRWNPYLSHAAGRQAQWDPAWRIRQWC